MKRPAQNKRELMIEVWEELECESVGDQELLEIQLALLQAFGNGAVDSPAAIARVLADEGAVLRHPEVLACDVKWRRSRITAGASEEEHKCSNLHLAEKNLLSSAERWSQADDAERARLRERVNEWGRESDLISQSRIAVGDEKVLAAEIRSWIGIWLLNPEMFADWLSLRQRAPEFVERFVTEPDPRNQPQMNTDEHR